MSDQLTNIPAAAEHYRLTYDWKVLTLKPGTKAPEQDGWQQFAQRPWDEIKGAFNVGHNLGVMLGPTSNDLTDIDLDWPEARRLAEEGFFLGSWSFGREGQPPGHYLVTCKDWRKIARLGFTEAEAELLGLRKADKAVVLEMRGNGQTMLPPSIHESGERVVWRYQSATLPETEKDALTARLGLLAFLSVVLRTYPRTSGSRDEICLALSGALLSAGLPPEQADHATKLVAQLAGDEQYGARGKASATNAKRQSGEPCTGLTKLCELLGIAGLEKKLRKWLNAGREETAPEGAIVMADGRLNSVLDQAEAALLSAGTPLYQRGPELVRPAKLDRSEDNGGIKRPRGSTVLMPITPHWLVQAMARSAPWMRYNPITGKLKASDPELGYAAHLLARAGDWHFPVLRGIVNAPTLRQDGSALQSPGYDALSQLIYEPAGIDFPPVPDSPTKDEAVAALAQLAPLFTKFPFVSEAARSVIYAAILTGLIRRTMRHAPLFAIDAPTPGTGKSLLAEVIGIIITGHVPAMFSMGKNEEEFTKQLSVVLRAGDPLVVFDNQSLPIQGDFLCSALTQELVQARILGKSERMLLPSNCLILATGNNLQLAGDVSRRAVICRIDSGEERPDKRQFEFDPRVLAAEHRPQLVVAALTAMRAYIAAGRPAPLAKIGSFEDFNLVREALVWLGHADPAETRAAVFDNDPIRDTITELLREWRKLFGGDPLTMSSLHQLWLTDQAKYGPLISLITDLTGRPIFNARSAGRKLMGLKDRVVGGLVLRRWGDSEQGAAWQVVSTDPNQQQAKQAALNYEGLPQ